MPRCWVYIWRFSLATRSSTAPGASASARRRTIRSVITAAAIEISAPTSAIARGGSSKNDPPSDSAGVTTSVKAPLPNGTTVLA